MYWKRNLKETPKFKKHFVWAQYVQVSGSWAGRVQATTGPIEKTIKAATKLLENQITCV
jgi:hypothetical protein